MVDAPQLVSSDASPTRPEWAVMCSTPAARAAAWNRSPTIFGESGTTRSAGAGLAAARSVRTADAVLRRRVRGGSERPDGSGAAALHEPDVPRLALLVRLPAADGDQHPVAVGRVVDVGPAQRADLAPPHPAHEEEPGDHGVEAAAVEGNLLGLAAAPARLVAGGEDSGEVRRPERPRLPPFPTACRPPVAGEDPGRPFPSRARLAGEAGPEARRGHRQSTRSPARTRPQETADTRYSKLSMEPTVLASFAVALVAFGAVSRRMERGVVSPPMVFLGLGVVLGKLGWLDSGGGLLDDLTELTLVLVLFTDAARIDIEHLRLQRSLPARLLGIGLPLTVAAGAFAAWMLLPGLEPWEAVLLGAVLAPTDAALGQAVVSNPLVPVRVRQGLNVESGLNDGIALPLVLAAVAFASATSESGNLTHWLSFTILQVTLGPLAGAAVGYLGGRGVAWSIRAGWMNAPFQRLSVVGLAGLAFAAAELVGGNGFIAAFVAGLTLGNTERAVCTRVYEFGEAEGQLLTLVVFLIVGGVLVPAALPHWATGCGCTPWRVSASCAWRRSP